MAIVTTNEVEVTAASSTPLPTIVDLGKKSRKRVKKLRRGKPGGLTRKVQEVLEQMKEAGALPAGAHPVVVIVRERRKRNKAAKLWGMG